MTFKTKRPNSEKGPSSPASGPFILPKPRPDIRPLSEKPSSKGWKAHWENLLSGKSSHTGFHKLRETLLGCRFCQRHSN
jgi:hypothetical protein